MIAVITINLLGIIFSQTLYSQSSLFDNIEEVYQQPIKSLNTNSNLPVDAPVTKISLDNKPISQYISLPGYRNTNGKKTLVVNISKQKFGAYNASGALIKTGRVSTGKPGHRTKRGIFNNLQKRGGASCWSKKFKVGIPYCIFYYRGFALHGYHHVPNYPASHGCIRMHVHNAQWLHNQFIDSNTVLIVH